MCSLCPECLPSVHKRVLCVSMCVPFVPVYIPCVSKCIPYVRKSLLCIPDNVFSLFFWVFLFLLLRWKLEITILLLSFGLFWMHLSTRFTDYFPAYVKDFMEG